jgi:hypothetical protein
MADTFNENGNFEIYQGDSYKIGVNDLPTDENYTVFYAVYDEERNQIGDELSIETFGAESVVIKVLGAHSDLYIVPEDKKSQKYYYGLKLCLAADGTEMTLDIGNSKKGDLNVITVFPRKVKGI